MGLSNGEFFFIADQDSLLATSRKNKKIAMQNLESKSNNSPRQLNAAVPKNEPARQINLVQQKENRAQILPKNNRPIGSGDDPNKKPGDSLSAAKNIGYIIKPVSQQYVIGTTDPKHFYKFKISQASDVSLTISGTTDWLKAWLIHDSDENLESGKDETIFLKDVAPNKIAEIKASLPKGTYYIQVGQYDGKRNSKYILKLSAKDIATLSPDPGNSMSESVHEIGVLEKHWEVSDIVGMTDQDDYFKFTLQQPKDITVTASGTVEWLRAYLIHDTDENLEVGKNEIIYQKDIGPNKAVDIKATLPIGSYFIRIAQYDKIRNSKYRLKISAKEITTFRKDPGNSMSDQVHNIGILEKYWEGRDVVGMTDENDYYDFDLSKPNSVSISLSGTVEWLRVYLIHDTDENQEPGESETIYYKDVAPN